MSVGGHPARSERRRAAEGLRGRTSPYGTNNEFGFDYLRDNMKFELSQYVQRGPPLRDRRTKSTASSSTRRARRSSSRARPRRRTDLYYEVDRIIRG
jgi:preprotein translocase subunit SecA